MLSRHGSSFSVFRISLCKTSQCSPAARTAITSHLSCTLSRTDKLFYLGPNQPSAHVGSPAILSTDMFLGRSNFRISPGSSSTQRNSALPEKMHTNRTFPDSPLWIVAPFTPLAIIAVVAFVSLGRFAPRYDPREPHVLPQKVPLLGHVFGLLQYGLKYYTMMR